MNIRLGRYEFRATRWYCWTWRKPFWYATHYSGASRTLAVGPFAFGVRRFSRAWWPWQP